MLACFYTSFIKDNTSRRLHLTEKFEDWVGHLNATLAQGDGDLNDPIFKSSNARKGRGGGAVMLKFRVDRRIICMILLSAIITMFYLNSLCDEAYHQMFMLQIKEQIQIINGNNIFLE